MSDQYNGGKLMGELKYTDTSTVPKYKLGTFTLLESFTFLALFPFIPLHVRGRHCTETHITSEKLIKCDC